MDEGDAEMRFQVAVEAESSINLADYVDIEHRIGEILSAEERSRLELTAEDEKVILASVCEQITPDLADEGIERSVTNCRKHYFDILSNTVKYILAVESTKSYGLIRPEWMKFFIANATKGCRDRLLRLLTDFQFQPKSFPYIFAGGSLDKRHNRSIPPTPNPPL